MNQSTRPACLIEFFEAIKTVSGLPHQLTGPGNSAELLRQFQNPNLRPDNLLLGGPPPHSVREEEGSTGLPNEVLALTVEAALAPSFASLIQYASLRGHYALLDSSVPTLPRAILHHVLWFRERSVRGLVLLVLALGGCTEWTIPPCEGTPFRTPCVGPCTVYVEPAGPTYTQVTMPLAVVIHDKHGKLHCQEIQP